MTQILITGASGYIGGDFLFALLDAHPELEGSITALSRSSDSAAKIAKVYPKIRYAYGSLDDVETLEKASAESDIVLHFADCDHVEAAKAITQGLASRAAQSKPAYLIHTSGTGMVTYADLKDKRYGEALVTQVYNDWDGVETVTSMPDEAWHRPVDKIVLASHQKGVRAAIVAPPTIYGQGRGPGNQSSIQWVKMAACGLKRGKGFEVGRGLNEWNYVHVHDLVKVYLDITEAALQYKTDSKIFGEKGYFFAEAGSYVWGDLARKIAKEGHKQGFLDTADVDSISVDEAEKLLEGGSAQWGLNSRVSAIRARKVFGWNPTAPSPDEIMAALVKKEADGAGLIKHHAQKAAGD